jgi:hypothetical protein
MPKTKPFVRQLQQYAVEIPVSLTTWRQPKPRPQAGLNDASGKTPGGKQPLILTLGQEDRLR